MKQVRTSADAECSDDTGTLPIASVRAPISGDPHDSTDLADYRRLRVPLGNRTPVLQLTSERPRRSWPEQVLPFGLAEIQMITPSRWTLTEASREVRLPASSPRRGHWVQRRRRHRATVGPPDGHL